MKQLILIVFVFASFQGMSQQINSFSLVNTANSQKVSLEDYSASAGLVIIFTANACPYDEYYRNRIAALAAAYRGKVPVVLVNAGTEAAESVPEMSKKAKILGLTIPYLADKEQKLLASLNARKTPEAFLLKNDGGKFSVIFSGAIDDNPQVEADVRKRYLIDAIEKMLANQTVQASEVRATGCNLRKN